MTAPAARFEETAPTTSTETAPEPAPKILVVDDTPANVRVLEAILAPRGYQVIGAASGDEALRKVAVERPDLVLLDIMMPGVDGHEVCRRLRADPATRLLPVVMVTASGNEQKVKAIEAGADDFIQKPLDPPTQVELLARVRSLLRIKQYQDTIQRQAAELAEWNRTLVERVQLQVAELERIGRLRRFLSPQVAEAVLSSGGEALLASHRRHIAVLDCDLRGSTAFAETAEPEDVMGAMQAYHAAMGELIVAHGATLEGFRGDGMLMFFNDPIPCTEPAARAVRLAVAMRDRMRDLLAAWRRRGHELGFGVGIAAGYATLGQIGFEGRFDYGSVGVVPNLASRLSGEAKPDQILISQRVLVEVEGLVEVEPAGDLRLKGIARPVPAYNVLALRADGALAAEPAGTAH